MSWFAQQRQLWIGETVRVFGFINREHIERKFGVSTSWASMDIQTFIRRNPDMLIYSGARKHYETTQEKA